MAKMHRQTNIDTRMPTYTYTCTHI